MKHVTLVAVSAIGLATFVASAFATQPSAGGSGVVAVSNTIAGGFVLGSNGTSVSYAQNSESATAKVTATASYTPFYKNVDAGVTGTTVTNSQGVAYNTSTGSGAGFAASFGGASASVQGALGIHGVTDGFNGGYSGTQSNNAIVAGTNQGSYVNGQTTSGFDVQVHYARTGSWAPGEVTKGVTVSDTKTGYASGASSTGALPGMNAAGLANIGATGAFFAKAGLSASTGTVTAP